MERELIKGLIAAPFTPMDEKGEINISVIEKYAGHLRSSGVKGAFVCGTTGEGASLTTAERRQVAEEWIRCAGSDLKIIVHVGSNCQKQSIDLARHAFHRGAYAVASIAPNFYRPESVTGLVDYFIPVAEAAGGLPFYYYHMPSISGFSKPASQFVIEAAKRLPGFAGVKYTHSDFVDMLSCINLSNGRYDILNGFDEMLICGLSIGAVSAVGSTYNFMPDIYIRIMEAFSGKNMEEARKLQEFSIRIVDIMKQFGGAIASGKNIMDLIGISCGQCRPPLRSFTEGEKQSLKDSLEKAGFFDRKKM